MIYTAKSTTNGSITEHNTDSYEVNRRTVNYNMINYILHIIAANNVFDSLRWKSHVWSATVTM